MTTLPNPFLGSAGRVEHVPTEAPAVASPTFTGADDVTADRFVLDVDAFMNDLEPLPAFLVAPSQAYITATDLIPVLEVLAGR